MRLRSSVRCSKKVIAPAGSSTGVVICELDSGSVTDSGRMLVVMECFLGIRDYFGSGLGFCRLFRRTWNRFDNRRDHKVLGGAGFCMNFARWCFRASGPSWREGRAGFGGGRSSSSFSSLFALGLQRLALHFAHFLFKGALKVRGGLAELGHELSEAAGELRQLLWPENHQYHDKHHNHVRDAQHCAWEPSKGSMGIIERVSAGVKPEFAAYTLCYNLSLSCHAR